MAQDLVMEERQGRHLCLQYSSDAELHAIAGTFVREGLAAGDRVGYVSEADAATVAGRLRIQGVACEPALRSGQLVIIALADIDPDADESRVAGLAARVQAFIEEGMAEGYVALRLASEVHALAPRNETLSQMRSREALASELSAALPVTGLCLYDRRRFAEDYLVAASHEHDAGFDPEPLYADELVSIARHPDRPGLRIAGEIDLSNIAGLEQALTSVAEESADGLTLDVSALRFICVAGLRAIVRAAADRPDSSVTLADADPDSP